MPLTGTGKVLGSKIAAKIIAPDADPKVKADIIALWESIGETIVDHVIVNTNLNVSAGIPVKTAGTAATQEGATTAPGNGVLL